MIHDQFRVLDDQVGMDSTKLRFASMALFITHVQEQRTSFDHRRAASKNGLFK